MVFLQRHERGGASEDCAQEVPPPALPSRRPALMTLTAAGILVHATVILYVTSAAQRAFLSNVIQVVLGVIAVVAMLDAADRSGRFAGKTWRFAAAALAAYTLGQAIYTYNFSFVREPLYAPRITDQVFFFWVAPLLMTVVMDPLREVFDWTEVLDFSQIIILALALHLFFFGDAWRWLSHGQEMEFLKWKVRLIRDVFVLTCLLVRFGLAEFRTTRSLFLRLGIFYFTYSLADALYLYAEATRGVQSGTFMDLCWSVPRLAAVVVAVTWKTADEEELRRPSIRRRYLLLYMAPVVVPLAVLAISSRMFSGAPGSWVALTVASFAIASTRLLLTQSRQENALNDLHSSNDLLHSIIEGTSEAIYLKDSGGRYVLINTSGARHLGRTPDEVLGKTDHDMLSLDSAESIAKTDREILASARGATVEETVTAAGITRTFLSTKSPYRDSEGRAVGLLGISVDITERRRMEDHLRRVQRMESIGTFSGAIAHDFNNVLTVIKGYSQLVLSEVEHLPRVRDHVEQIDRAAERSASLTRQLLAFSRQQILQPRVVSLNDIIANMHKMLLLLIGEDVRIATHCAPDLGAVKVDPGQIEQVLMNLAANARDAMPEGGRLTLETSNVELDEAYARSHVSTNPGPYVMLAVSDTGVGMDAQTQSRIFEPFFTTKALGKGTGLGLATVYGIVKQSGGYIWVYSEPGSGTTFRIYLPRVEQPLEHVTRVSSSAAVKHDRRTVLLVEDDVQLRELARSVLTESGFTVLVADSGDEADKISALHPGPLHLLLTDVVMPGLGGREVARRVCSRRRETRVLYMSGYTGDAIVHHSVLDAGICFLQKPFTPNSLVEKVCEVLNAPPNGQITMTLN